MRKLYKLLLISYLIPFISNAQNREAEINEALRLVSYNRIAIGLSADDLNNVRISDTYVSSTSGLTMIYLQQAFKGIPVYNQIQVLAFKNDSLVSIAGNHIPDIEKLANVKSGIPSVSPEAAIHAVLADRNLSTSAKAVVIKSSDNGQKIEFNDMGVSHENITAQLMWSPVESDNSVRLAWQVYIISKASSDYWLIRVDAINRSILGIDNLTVFDRWDKNETKTYYVIARKNSRDFDYSHSFNKTSDEGSTEDPFIVNGATYRVIPYPAESPRHPGGTAALITDPWLAAPGNATSLKWHSNGTLDYDITRGNNVWAKEDRAGNNSNSGLPAISTTSPDPLTFNFIPDLTVAPTQTTPVPNQQFNITNLFYWINIFHDVTYLYGFDEPAGNFQANNQGRGGNGNDWVYGDAQDGNGTNNANFSTPPDGGSGRMQMYLWSAVPNLIVNSPSSIAGPYTAVESGFSTNNLLQNVGPRTGQVVYYNDDPAGTTHYACGAPANSITGKIALIDRGFGGATCASTVPFTIKVKNAQDAGAIAVIMVNNVPGDPITMGGSDNTIIIPAVMISQGDGTIIAAELANNVNVTMSPGPQLDGDADNGIIVHEYGHGISNRLTGGPGTASCLQNAEQMGEGWSDYYALMLTQNWATANLNTGFNSPRGIGTYAVGQGPNGSGIRSQKYCTDFAVNNLVYATAIPASSHDRGEIWCAALWDMTWNIIQQVGSISSSIYDVSGTGGNIIALRLVTEAMKLQPCSPGFISGRDAILQADANLFGGQYECAIREAFRRRGMGVGASQGSSSSVTDQTPSFVGPTINITTQPQSATVCEGNNNTFTVVATVNTGVAAVYQWQVDDGSGFTDITNGGVYSGTTTASLILTAVTAAMDGYQFRCVVNGKCATTVNSNVATLTVGNSVSITQQPNDATVCEPGITSFTVAGSGSGLTYKWQLSTDGGNNYSDISNGGIYSGATTATLNITGVTALLNNNYYRAIISSSTCAVPVSSNAAILTVNTVPSITSQAQSASLCTGNNTTFSIAAAGTGISYQWQVNTGSGFTDIANGGVYSGVTTASITITGATAGMTGYQYRCIVSGACTPSANSNAVTLSVSDPVSVTADPANVTICESGNAQYTATGSSSTIYQWQVSTDGGPNFSNITSGGVYSGATSATLSLSNITQSMDGYRYRVVMSNAVCTTPAISNAAGLTVNARPSVSLSASPFTSLLPGRSTTLTATIIPSAAGFNISWYRNGTVIPGITGTTYTADVTTLGDYRVDIVNTVTGCNNQSQILTIKDSASDKLFIFPSPNNGQFTVSYYNANGSNTNRTVAVYDAHGALVYNRKFAISGPYTLLSINLGAAQTGVYVVVVGDAAGNRLIEGKVMVGH